ncbi:MAG: phenylacetate--CoA ligase family protein [Thermoguttaceae bacterium]
MFYDPAESMSFEERRGLQVARLRETLARVAASVPFYQRRFAACGLDANAIASFSLDDLARLPVTTKAELRGEYPLGMLAVPQRDVARYHGSSGTTGKPTMVAYTKRDLITWSELCARFLVSGGLRREHTVQIAFGYGLFTGGFGLHYGVERVGAAIVPAASGNTQRQVSLLRDMAVDALVCTPSYALTIAEAIIAAGVDLDTLPLKFAFLGGEPWTEAMRNSLESLLPVRASNNYGLSEVIGPGVSGECECRDGMHIQEDHFIVECVDPETLQSVADGTPGELVFTSLTREAMPIIRYRTRDIAAIHRTPCDCGRTTCRMSRVIGRSDDMMIIRGVNVYPSQIEEILLSVSGAAPHYQIVLERPHLLDEVHVRVEVAPDTFSDKVSDMTLLKSNIARAILTTTGLHIAVELLPPGTLQRFEGKAQRVVDNREFVKELKVASG